MVARDVGEEGGEVESRALAHWGQDGWRRVGGHGGGVIGHPNWRTQVALVGGDARVEGRGDEGGWFVRGDDERLGPRSALQFGLPVLIQARITLPVLDGEKETVGLGVELGFYVALPLFPTPTHPPENRD